MTISGEDAEYQSRLSACVNLETAWSAATNCRFSGYNNYYLYLDFSIKSCSPTCIFAAVPSSFIVCT